MREWVESLSPIPRFFVLVGLVVLGNLVIVAVVCLIAGWTDAVGISNALFYAAAAMLLLSVLAQWGSPAGKPSRESEASRPESSEEEQVEAKPLRVGPRTDEVLEDMMRRRARPFSPIAGILMTAGLVLFGLSILLPAIWG